MTKKEAEKTIKKLRAVQSLLSVANLELAEVAALDGAGDILEHSRLDACRKKLKTTQGAIGNALARVRETADNMQWALLHLRSLDSNAPDSVTPDVEDVTLL